MFAIVILILSLSFPACSGGTPGEVQFPAFRTFLLTVSNTGTNTVQLKLAGTKWYSNVAIRASDTNGLFRILEWKKTSGDIDKIADMKITVTCIGDSAVELKFEKASETGEGRLRIDKEMYSLCMHHLTATDFDQSVWYLQNNNWVNIKID